MQAYVYKSRRKSDTYVYLREREGFGLLPEPLRSSLGELDFVLEVALTPERRLAREDATVVHANLGARGFHLQLPPQHDGGAHFVDHPRDMSSLTPPPAPPAHPSGDSGRSSPHEVQPASGERSSLSSPASGTGTAASLRDPPLHGDDTHGDA